MRRTVAPAVLVLALAPVVAGCSWTAGSGHSSVGAIGRRARPAASSATHASLLSKLLPEPAGATAWPSDKTGVMDIDGFVDNFYAAQGRAASRSRTLGRGFSTSARAGWVNSDGTQSDIWLVEFDSEEGARSMYLSTTANWKSAAKPATTFPDTAVHGTGELLPQPDSRGNSSAKVAAYDGRLFVYVRVWSPAAPSKGMVVALMKAQYARLGGQ
ncbi:hypothetical protein [Actinacidiphila acidipaludis]|uniref:DUF3558 domain-containing protein n=1 Tax=Actinacidiphila acidipaludis TaxID=2873382 RepID=A0ABS7QHF6_9ACTN|nr:hypothetical protein [Streptomyces acidipaludis]MBY8882597.1 hypothetical protein [Streptomyces acidipaludis]